MLGESHDTVPVRQPKAYDSGPPSIAENRPVSAQREVSIERRRDAGREVRVDLVAVEDPLEIRLSHAGLGPAPVTLSLTMRTPGHDAELALGYLYCESVIAERSQVVGVAACAGNARALRVELTGPVPDLSPLQRVGTLSSSCGVCGKTSLESVTAVSAARPVGGTGTIEDAVLRVLPGRLRAAQATFALTGGLHGVGLFDFAGNLLAAREDVGRHNALDKLIGHALLQGGLPFTDHVLLLSGRASFELLQKAAMAGASIVAAVGAPSSLAIEMAQAAGITLVGFLNERGFNVYTHGERIR